ncbi:unnamed protein product, partial [marine sediment metagenome]
CRLSDMGYKIYYDILGAAAYAGVTRHTIYHWIRKGVKDVDGKKVWLPARIVEGETQINEIDFELYLEALGFEEDESTDESTEDNNNNKPEVYA